MQIDAVLKKRDVIYGICAIWIVLFHVYRRISMPYIPVLTNILGLGNMGVDVFMFISGVCLSLSANRSNYNETGWKVYFQKRLSRVLIPYLLIAIPYYTWHSLVEYKGVDKFVKIIKDVTSYSFWTKGTQTTWFVFAILVFYLLFPIIYNISKNGKPGVQIIMILIMCGFAVLTAYVPGLKNSTICWARLPVFAIGVIIGCNPKRFRAGSQNQIKWLVGISVLLLLVLGTLISFWEVKDVDVKPVIRFLLYIPTTLALMTVLSYLTKGEQSKKNLMALIGTLSLEIYLVHITLLHPFKYYGIMKQVGYWLYLILPVIAVLISWVISKIEKFILKRIERS